MIWMVYIFTGIVLMLVILFFFVSKFYNIRPVPHTKTPEAFAIPFNEIRFPTQNQKQLYGWWIPQPDKPEQHRTIILVHGWKRNVGRMLPYIKPLFEGGFNLLVFDARNHGSSDRDLVASMPKFTEDIIASIDFLQSMNGFENVRVGLIGLSMGGSASIYAAACDKRISRLITVGAFADPHEIMAAGLREVHIPYIPLGWLILKYAQHRIGVNFKTFAPINNIGKIDVPTLLIHGQNDETIPLSQVKNLKKASCQKTTELWIIPDKGHSDCHYAVGFWGKVIAFMNQA